MLEIQNLCAAYGEATVLDRVSMRVGEGEIVALLGRNGMGKTSLVRSIMALGSPRVTSGSIRFDGFAPVPEPGTIAMILLSLGGLGFSLRKRA